MGGGVEADEPPSKRPKPSLLASGSLSGNRIGAQSSIPLGGPIGRSQGNQETIGSKGLIRKTEYVRVISDALYSLGYVKTGASLEEESGIHLNSHVVDLFRKQVLDGNWDGSVVTLRRIGLEDDNVVKSASFLILEQKFFQLLEEERVVDALKTLRNEIVPLSVNRKRVHELCSFLVLEFANLGIDSANSRVKLLEELQKLLPPVVMVAQRRLEQLVEQALSVQRETCYFHNSLDNTLTLYTDHQCGKDQIPSRTVQVLQGHQNEIWYLQFSNNGRYLASASNDRSVIIWEVLEDGSVSLKHTLSGHQKPVLMVAWSPNDSELLTCGMDEVLKRWDVHSGECLNTYEKSGLGFGSCGWLPDGKCFFSGVTDKSICLWDLKGQELECWKGKRASKTSDMAITKDGKRIVTMSRESAILVLDREGNFDKCIEEEQTVTSFSLSNDDNFLLVNLANQELHVWSISDEPVLVMRYKGHKRTRFLIRSCFGGSEDAYIASGSEDSQVYIWHRGSGDLIGCLPGHSGAVNCVSWNPANPHMLASASDDRTIRIWGINSITNKLKRKEAYSNGIIIHRCNGNGKC